ncbi:hypothetical protein ACP275_14G208900 [Erythranthe tilingii]
MDKPIMKLKLLAAATIMLLSLHTKSAKSQWFPRRPPVTPQPLCTTQFALANRACATLPYTVVPLPTSLSLPTSPSPPPPPGADAGGGGGGGGGRHHHHHRHGGARQQTPEEEECCRWLKNIDSVCVCKLLLYLPPFLTRPHHNYGVDVGGLCDISFNCGSRLVQF